MYDFSNSIFSENHTDISSLFVYKEELITVTPLHIIQLPNETFLPTEQGFFAFFFIQLVIHFY